jgi:voltage-gated potassium channel
MGERRYLYFATLYLAFVFLVGVFGLHALEGKSFIDATYLTVVSLTTVGLGGGVDRMGDAGRLLTIFVILNGVGVASYVIGVFAKMIVGGELRQILGQSYMQHRIKSMEGHVVICGCSDSTQAITREFDDAKTDYLVIDSDAEKVEALLRREVPAIHGDASRRDPPRGGVGARALVANLPTTPTTSSSCSPRGRSSRPVHRHARTSRRTPTRCARSRPTGDLAGRDRRPAHGRLRAQAVRRRLHGRRDPRRARLHGVGHGGAGAEVVGKSIRDADIRTRSGVAMSRSAQRELLRNPSRRPCFGRRRSS